MKIALISHLYPTKLFPFSGKFIKDHFDLLCEQEDIEVDLIIPTPYSIPGTKRFKKNRSIPVGVCKSINKIHYLSFPNKNFPTSIKSSLSRSLLGFLKGKKYDLIHIHWLFPDGLAIPDLKKHGFKTVLTIHGSDWYQSIENPELESLIEDTFESTDCILYSGPKLSSDVQLKFPVFSEKSDIIYNMVNPKVYYPLRKDIKESLRLELQWDSKKVHALTVANIRPEKGIDKLVKLISSNEKLKDIQFHIIGSLDGSVFSKRVVKNIRLNPFSNIELHPPVNPNELTSFYQAADFFVLPSRREGFNVSILEAAASGLPLVCTDVGGNKEVINLKTGLLATEMIPLSTQISTMSKIFSEFEPQELHSTIISNYGSQIYIKNLKRKYAQVLEN